MAEWIYDYIFKEYKPYLGSIGCRGILFWWLGIIDRLEVLPCIDNILKPHERVLSLEKSFIRSFFNILNRNIYM
jgi:hypothetical protein